MQLKISRIENHILDKQIELATALDAKLKSSISFVDTSKETPTVIPPLTRSEASKLRWKLIREKRGSFVMLMFLFLATTAWAADVRLSWVPSVSTNAIGTKIYWGGQSRVYTNSIDVGSVTNCAVSNLMSNTRYYFAATAYDSAGNESTNFSNEAVWPIVTSPGGFWPGLY
jgi:hypothetical protein